MDTIQGTKIYIQLAVIGYRESKDSIDSVRLSIHQDIPVMSTP